MPPRNYRLQHVFLQQVLMMGVLWLVAARLLAAQASPFSVMPGESVLLLGDPTVARTTHLTQRFFPAQRHPANPVLRRSEPWEGVGPYIWGNRLMQDEK